MKRPWCRSGATSGPRKPSGPRLTLLWGTDENTLFDLVIECKRFIEPGQPGLMEFDALANIGIRAARSLAALFLSAKSPYDGPSVEATHYALQPSTDAKRHAGLHLTVLNQILNEATGSGRVFLTKRFGLNVVDELNDEEIRATESAYQGELLATIGGPKALMAPFAPKKRDDGRYTSDAMELAYAEFSKLVNMPSFQNGTDPVGKANAFSDEELAYMRAQAPKYFHAYEQTFLGMLVGALSDANFDPEGSIGGETAGKLSFPYAADPTELATALNDLANAIATAEVPERFTATIDATTIDVAKPGFSYGTRAAAMALFSSDLYDQAGKTFNQGGSDPTKALLQARLDALTGGDGTLLERLPRDIFHEWGYVGSIMAKLGDSH